MLYKYRNVCSRRYKSIRGSYGSNSQAVFSRRRRLFLTVCQVHRIARQCLVTDFLSFFVGFEVERASEGCCMRYVIDQHCDSDSAKTSNDDDEDDEQRESLVDEVS